jgi:hypothetical protein
VGSMEVEVEVEVEVVVVDVVVLDVVVLVLEVSEVHGAKRVATGTRITCWAVMVTGT